MAYQVYFVGLVCFYREHGTRLALLPDGLTPFDGIDPHYPSIIVSPGAVETSEGWNGDGDTSRGIYLLPHCTISIEGMDVAGTLDVSQHDGVLPQLRQIDPNFEIDPATAQTSARLTIRQGALTAHAIPGGNALISRAVVPHEGAINIIITPTDGSTQRTLRLQAGSEIIVGNMAPGGVYKRNLPPTDPASNHFRIFERLSVRPVTLQEPASVAALAPPTTTHWYFVEQREINLNTNCTNTGCC